MNSSLIQRQQLIMTGRELCHCISVRDESRALEPLENKVELSEEVFTRHFADREEIVFHLEDRTPGRPGCPQHYFGLWGTVHYRRNQNVPVVIILGTTYSQKEIRENLWELERLRAYDCGTYFFYVEKETGRYFGSVKREPTPPDLSHSDLSRAGRD